MRVLRVQDTKRRPNARLIQFGTSGFWIPDVDAFVAEFGDLAYRFLDGNATPEEIERLFPDEQVEQIGQPQRANRKRQIGNI